MKRGLAAGMVMAVLLALIVGIWGYHCRWFRKEKSTSGEASANHSPTATVDIQSPAFNQPRALMNPEAEAMLDVLKDCNQLEVYEHCVTWRTGSDEQRRTAWEAVRCGLTKSNPNELRLRLCTLANTLVSPTIKAPCATPQRTDADALLALTDAKEDASIRDAGFASVRFLDNACPSLGLKAEARRQLEAQIASTAAEDALLAAKWIPLYGFVDMAGQVVDAWERHQDNDVMKKEISRHLALLAVLVERERLDRTNSDMSSAERLARSSDASKKRCSEYGNDLSKWRAYFTHPLQKVPDSSAGAEDRGQRPEGERAGGGS